MPTKGNIQTGDWVAKVELSVDVAIHASGDLLADRVEIPEAVKANGMSIIQSVNVTNFDNQAVNLDLIFFGEDPDSLGARNAALAISDGVAEKIQGTVTVDTWKDMGAQQIGTESSKRGLVVRSEGGTSIWVASVSRGTGTYPTGRLVLWLGLLRG